MDQIGKAAMGDVDLNYVQPVMMQTENTRLGPISPFTQFLLIAPLLESDGSIASISWIPSEPSPFGCPCPSEGEDNMPVARAVANTSPSAESTPGSSNESFIKITIYSADNVPKMDLFSETDSFVLLEFDDQTFQTATLDNAGSNPQWREDFVIPLTTDRCSRQILIKATLYDEDPVSIRTKIGSVTIDITQNILQKDGKGVLDQWYPLTGGPIGRSAPPHALIPNPQMYLSS
jgi:hypothetical protein